MTRLSIFNFFGGPSSKKLAQAIEDHDLKAMHVCLEAGVRTIDHTRYREGDRPGEKIPTGRFLDPVKLARDVGMTEDKNIDGLKLLARYGLVDEHYKNYLRCVRPSP